MTECVRGCAVRGVHLPGCDGTGLGRAGEVAECLGCLPRPAEVGYLCPWCWGRLQSLVRTLPALIEHLFDMAAPSVRSPSGRGDGGRGPRPGGHGLYPEALAAADDLHAVLATWCAEVAEECPQAGPVPRVSRVTRTPLVEVVGPVGRDSTRRLVGWLEPHLEWVASQEWVGDLLEDLGPASARAWARWPVVEPERRVTTVRCPRCGQRSLVVTPPSVRGAQETVRCSSRSCGLVLAEEDWASTRALALLTARQEAGQCR